jgi:hypothetical protein
MRGIRCWHTTAPKRGFTDAVTPHSSHNHHPSRGPIQMPAWQRLGLYASLAVVAASGLAWLLVHFSADTAENMTALAGQQWAVRLHVAAALWLLVLLGSLMPLHMRAAWRAGRNRWGGAGLSALMAVLTLTGYLLWYAPEGMARQWAEWLHWAVGCGVPAALVLHIWWGRRTARFQRTAHPQRKKGSTQEPL